MSKGYILYLNNLNFLTYFSKYFLFWNWGILLVKFTHNTKHSSVLAVFEKSELSIAVPQGLLQYACECR